MNKRTKKLCMARLAMTLLLVVLTTETARGAPEAGRRVSVPQRGRDALSACVFVWYHKLKKQ